MFSKKDLFFAAKVFFVAIVMGAGVQLGFSMASHIAPRVDVIEIRTTDQSATTPVG